MESDLLRRLINDFAVRSFRDIADQDYISARQAYAADLFQQFHWASLQAVEKYLKAILLFNRIKAKDIQHDLGKALKYTEDLPFPLRLAKSTKMLINHLDMFGAHRYLESSFHIRGPKLLELDKAVWEIRRYCRVLNHDVTLANGERKNMLDVYLRELEAAERAAPQRLRLTGGLLEKIIRNVHHPARRPLIWQNAYFGVRARRSVTINVPFHAVNAPLALHPELLDEILKYVHLPKHVVRAYRAYTATGAVESASTSAG